jgi:hypothetical protein
MLAGVEGLNLGWSRDLDRVQSLSVVSKVSATRTASAATASWA